ncbi:MAG TPA: extracellular solute-binding protein [Chloroflexaceae bacterium]|nr:extracellular solute-binding protein [Chloroflexaceae bacterium]
MIASTPVRAARLAACLLLVALWLAACAAPTPPAPATATALPPTPSPVAVAATATSVPTAAPPPTPTPAPQALTLWVAEEGPALDVVRELAAEFSVESGAPIEVVARPPDGLRLSLATAALAGDSLPDLLWADGEALAGLLADDRLQPLDPALAADDLLPALRTAATADGELWGAPVAASGGLLLLYNRAMVPAAPRSSDALIVGARAAQTPEVAGMVMAWDEARWLLPWLYAFGGAPTSPDGLAVTLDTPAMTPTLNLVRELYTAAPKNGAGYARGRRLLAQGYAAYAIDGDWSLPMYRAVSDTLDLGIAPMPVVPATGRAAAPTLNGTYLMLARELAGEPLARGRAFAGFLADPATQDRLAQALGRLPPTVSALERPGAPWAADPALAAAAALAGQAPGLPPTVAARCALYGIDVWLPSLLRGSIPASELPLRMQREAEACVARSS